jgi:hypothetical protein
VTKDQTLRFGMTRGASHTDNLGLGSFDLPERAYSTRNDSWSFRAQEAGPLGRRFFTNTRFNISSINSSATSFIEAPTVIVLDQFTSGGAQQRGATHGKNFTLVSDLDYVRGRNSPAPVSSSTARATRTRSAAISAPTHSRAAGVRRRQTAQFHDPHRRSSRNGTSSRLLSADDLRLRKNLTISAGVRVEAQTHLNDYNNVGPRAGITWSPFKSGKTSVRASWGIFYDGCPPARISKCADGRRPSDGNQRDQPGVPGAGHRRHGAAGQSVPARGWAPHARNDRVISVSQQLGRRFGIYETYATARVSQFVGRNLNAPVNGVQPNPTYQRLQGRRRPDARRSVHISQPLAQRHFSHTSGPPMMMPGSVGPFFSGAADAAAMLRHDQQGGDEGRRAVRRARDQQSRRRMGTVVR